MEQALSTARILRALGGDLDTFLEKWTVAMDRAGYLEFTTAKREDCRRSLQGFLQPLLDCSARGAGWPGFGALLGGDRDWARFLVGVARRHRARGITAEMFLGCFQALVQCVEEMILELDEPAEDKLRAVRLVRRFGDAFATVFIGDWEATSQQEAHERLDETNRRLTLEKNKYENILDATSDLVLMAGADGLVLEANAAAVGTLGPGLTGHPLWEVLDLEGRGMDDVLRYYPPDEGHEVALGEGCFYSLRIVPMQEVSLASHSYMVLLSNISCLVRQRVSLEARLEEKAAALANSEKQFEALYQAAGEGILLVDIDLHVVAANRRCGQVFGLLPEELLGRHCADLGTGAPGLDQVVINLEEDEIWSGELTGLRADGDAFPMAATVNRVDLDALTVFQVLVRDVTGQKALEQRLRTEKRQQEEMNITLRTVMKSVDKERQDLESMVSDKVRHLILPALDKVRDEDVAAVRKGFVDVVEDQLLKLCSAGPEQDGRLLRLSPAEMQVCRFVQAGSSNKDIAEAMNLSIETVQTHRKNIRRKLGLQGRGVNLHAFLRASGLDRARA
jgi:PAS domain S-box-containing protein